MPEALKNLSWVNIAVIVGQLIGLVAWAVHVEDRVKKLEADHLDMDRRIDQIDERGTRKLQLIDERQVQFRVELNELRQLLNNRR